jgi:hypothetical protein
LTSTTGNVFCREGVEFESFGNPTRLLVDEATLAEGNTGTALALGGALAADGELAAPTCKSTSEFATTADPAGGGGGP